MSNLPHATRVDFYLEFHCVDRFLLRASDLEELDELQGELRTRLNACDIYLLCKRPRISVVPGSLATSHPQLLFDVSWRICGVEKKGKAAIPLSAFEPEEVGFEVSPYPHREIISKDAHGKHVATTLVANHVMLFNVLPHEVKQLNVLYIGKGVASGAIGRLRNHSPMQRILRDLNSSFPDDELFVLLLAFDRPKLNVVTMVPEHATPPAEAELTRMRGLTTSAEERVSLVEAALIGYFKPERNIHYSDFPRRLSTAARRLSDAGFTALSVVIDLEAIAHQKIGSQDVTAASEHLVLVSLTGADLPWPFSEIQIGGVVRQPYGAWMTQVARNLADGGRVLIRKRYLLHDRDPLFTDEFRGVPAAAGWKCLRLPARSPNLNAVAERFVLNFYCRGAS